MPDSSDERLRIAGADLMPLQEAAFRQSPLAPMAEWLQAGRAPRSADLRAAGLIADCPDPRREAGLRLARKHFIRTWGFSIPCAEAIEVLWRLGPLVEIGAGSAYWTALLRAAGADMIATDPAATGDVGYGFEAGRYCAVEPLAGAAAVQAHPDRDVFCSWPTEGSPWALAAARAMRPGRRLALIGAGRGGTTGTPGLFRYLETRFEHLGALQIPQFPGARDRLDLYRRVR